MLARIEDKVAELTRVAQLVFNQCHYITPGAAAAIVRAIEARRGSDSLVAAERNGGKGYRVTKAGTAILPIVGELVNRGAWLGAQSGLVSYEGLRQQFRDLEADRRVKRIILDVNSPGGQAAGMIETAVHLRRLSKVKPVVAYANSLMASAAYSIASGATKIAATKFASVGSIGVVYIHQDHSRALDRAGVKVTLIHAGKHKVAGNPFEPLPESVQAEIQKLVGRHYEALIDTVLNGRPVLSARAVRSMEGRLYDADDAKSNGLVDEVTTFDNTLERFEAGACDVGRYRSAEVNTLAMRSNRIAARIA